MLKDYNNVIKFIERLNKYSIDKYNKKLADIEYEKNCLEDIFNDSEYRVNYDKIKESLIYDKNNYDKDYVREVYRKNMPDIDLDRQVEDMSDNDLMNFLNCLSYSQLGDMILIRYNEIRMFNNKLASRSPFDIYGGLLRECRSIVIDIRKFKILSVPFYKFMNMNESEEYLEHKILDRIAKAKKVEYSEKLDGSFIQITKLDEKYDSYIYDDLLTSSQNIVETEIVKSARDWYEKHTEYKSLVHSYSEYTLMFEWISLKDKHVVKYEQKDCGLWLIGMRHKTTGELVEYHKIVEISNKFGVRYTEVYDITYDKLRENLEVFKASEKEGYVISIDGFLVKMKCTDYLNMVKVLKESGHENAIIRAISDNKLDELLTILPEEYHSRVEETASKIFKYIEDIETKITELSDYVIKYGVEDKALIVSWINTLPKLLRGSVKTRYFNNLYGKNNCEVDYLRTNHQKLLNNYISFAELERRIKVVESTDINKYKTVPFLR